MYSLLLETVRFSCVTSYALSDFILVGVYMSGPFWGKIADTRGPRLLLIAGFISLLSGYSGIRGLFDAGLGNATELSRPRLVILILCSFITGIGANSSMAAAMNTTAKNFPDHLVSPLIFVVPSTCPNIHPACHGRRFCHVRFRSLRVLLFLHLAH